MDERKYLIKANDESGWIKDLAANPKSKRRPIPIIDADVDSAMAFETRRAAKNFFRAKRLNKELLTIEWAGNKHDIEFVEEKEYGEE